MPDSKIIFIHIPKAAGSTLAAVLKRKYKDRVLFLDGSKANESIDNFIASPVAKRNQYDMIFGHMDFGLLQVHKEN